MNKTRSCRIHAKKRALERYNLEVDRKLLNWFAEQIKNNKAIFFRRRSNRVTNWIVRYKEQDYLVSYDKQRKTIITFLPKEKMDKNTIDKVIK